jgi:hypothetical protein
MNWSIEGDEMRSARNQAKRRLTRWSRRAFDQIDQRLAEAKQEQALIKGLVEHIGGKPSLPQTIMIKRIARLTLLTAQLERRAIEADALGDLEQRQLCALSNSLRLYLSALGLERPAALPATLKNYLSVAGSQAA